MTGHVYATTPHETPRWNRVRCKRCGAKEVVHRWDMDRLDEKFSRHICLPPPPVSVAEEEGTTCLEDSKRTT